MKLKKVDIKNFRLLSSVSLNIEDDFTLIVGKNNTGKTSLFEAINIFTSENANRRLSFVDFPQSAVRNHTRSDIFSKRLPYFISHQPSHPQMFSWKSTKEDDIYKPVL